MYLYNDDDDDNDDNILTNYNRKKICDVMSWKLGGNHKLKRKKNVEMCSVKKKKQTKDKIKVYLDNDNINVWKYLYQRGASHGL